jgi:hypothetical protein
MKNVEIDQDAINNPHSDKTSDDMLFTTEIREIREEFIKILIISWIR